MGRLRYATDEGVRRSPGILPFVLFQLLLPAPVEQEGSHTENTWLDVVRVVDGDTLWVRRAGEVEKLRLLSVDTEERISDRAPRSGATPGTVFGHETALWAQAFFEARRGDRAAARVRLRFPPEGEERDVYGRLLCHVVLEGGRDYNLLLVELGKSPYFVKYGWSRVAHEAFLAAEGRARAAGLGIWDDATNRPASPGAPRAARPYATLRRWWSARADAIEAYRQRRRREPGWVAAADPAELQRAAEAGAPVNVFGEPLRVVEELDGSLTAVFGTGDRRRPLRVTFPAELRDSRLDELVLGSVREFSQNYFAVRGGVVPDGPGFRMVAEDAQPMAALRPLPPSRRPSKPSGS